jgi:type IV secretory pathway VirB4 component
MGDLLLPVGLVADGVVLSRDGSMSATWKFRGPDMASETHDHMAVASRRLNQVLREMGDRWMLQVDAFRFASPGYCAEGDFPDITSRVIDEERRQQFLREGQHFETDYFLTSTYLPPPLTERKATAWMFEGQESQGEKGDAQRALDEFLYAISLLESRLESLLTITRLKGQTIKDEYGFETVHDDQLRFMRRTITGIDHTFARPDIPFYLNDLLSPEDFVGGLAPRLGRRHVRVVAIEGFPKASHPGILARLGHFSMEYRWSTRAILLDRESGIKVCDKARSEWQGQTRKLIDVILQRIGGPVNLFAQEMVNDAEELRGTIASGEVRMVHYSSNFVCMHEDRGLVDANAAYLVKTIQDLGLARALKMSMRLRHCSEHSPPMATAMCGGPFSILSIYAISSQ